MELLRVKELRMMIKVPTTFSDSRSSNDGNFHFRERRLFPSNALDGVRSHLKNFARFLDECLEKFEICTLYHRNCKIFAVWISSSNSIFFLRRGLPSLLGKLNNVLFEGTQTYDNFQFRFKTDDQRVHRWIVEVKLHLCLFKSIITVKIWIVWLFS